MHILLPFKDKRSYSFEELLDLTNYNEDKLEELLNDQIDKKIIEYKNETFTLQKRYFIGRLDRKENFGFLLLDKDDLYIDYANLSNALNKDLILVKKGRDNKVIEVLQRATHEVVCIVKKFKDYSYLIPKANIGLPVVIKNMKPRLDDEVILVELVEFRKYAVIGIVKEVIGFLYDPDIEILTLVYEYGFPYKFSKEAIKEANEIDASINIDSREIIKDEYIVTIDGEDAKDLDDAVSLKLIDDKYHLSVHIADVSHYVKEGSYIDKDAYERATSAYLADRVIPMLPQRLSNDLCSLNDELKYTLSVFMIIDKEGKLLNHEIKETIIQVDQRLSYNQVNNYFNGKTLNNKELEVMLDHMKDLAKLLGEQRYNKGSINFESVEYQYILDDENNIADIEVREQGTSENIIEEFMVLTNETVGSHLHYLDLPGIYRVHEKPKEEKLKELFTQLKDLNVKVPRHKNITPKTIQTMLENIEQRPDKLIIHELMLRAMNRARYDKDALGHFGLAKEYYGHFTAPIRRYPDLLLHRIVKDFLIHPKNIEKRIQYYENNISSIAEHSSKMERISIDLEREVDKLKIAEFMSDKVGRTYNAIVSGITKTGIFVKIEKGIEGMIPVRTMEDIYYYSSEKKQLIGASSNMKFNLGKKIVVKLVDVNVELRQITFKFLR